METKVKMCKKQNIHITLDKDLINRLNSIAANRGMKLSQIINFELIKRLEEGQE